MPIVFKHLCGSGYPTIFVAVVNLPYLWQWLPYHICGSGYPTIFVAVVTLPYLW